MKVLITGHKGYIGPVLTKMLLDEGYSVTGMDTELFRKCRFNDLTVPEVPSIQKDVRNAVLDDLKGFDAVLHLAGLSNDPMGDLNPVTTYDINYRGAVHIARLAKEAGVRRFVYASTCSVYGASDGNMIDESAPLKPVTPYAHSKLLAEKEISLLADRNFSPTMLRSATAYGVSPYLRFDLVVNNLVGWAMTTGQVYLKSDGTAWRPIVHIEDISRAYLAVLKASLPLVHDEVFNVGSTGENYRIRELAEIVKSIIPGSRVEMAPDGGPDKRCYRVNCDKILKQLPFFGLRWNALLGAQELKEAYVKASLKLEDFEGDRFSRIKHLQKILGANVVDDSLFWNETVPQAA